MAILGVDVGGTFTDAVLLDDGRVRDRRRCSTAVAQEESVARRRACSAGAADVERFAHGTTVATNALLERKGARTAFVTNAGFEHLLHLRRQTRAHLYRPCAAWPEPLVPLERCHGVRGRMGPDGELEPLDLDSLAGRRRRGGRRLPAARVSRRRARARGRGRSCGRRLPDAHVVASHEVAPEFREYERASTTAADAYLGPVVVALSATRSRRRARTEGCPSRSSCAPRAASRRRRRRPRIRRRSSSRARRRASSARRASRRSRGSTTRSRSTWAGRRPTSA